MDHATDPELPDDPPVDQEGRVKAELEPGERTLWVGRPVNRTEPFGCGFLGTAICSVVLWIASLVCVVSVVSRPFSNVEGPIAFGVISFFVTSCLTLGIVSNLSHRRRERTRRSATLYAMTDRRAIIWVPEGERGAVAVKSYWRGQVVRAHRVENPDGTGDVKLALRNQAESDPWGPQSAFLGVASVRTVEDIARRNLILDGDHLAG